MQPLQVSRLAPTNYMWFEMVCGVLPTKRLENRSNANFQGVHLNQSPEMECSFKKPPIRPFSPNFESGAVNDLFVWCIPALRKAAECLLRNREDSEDVLQDALLLGFQNIQKFQCRAKFSTWMHTILRNSARSMWRRRRCRPIGFSVDLEAYEYEHPHFADDFVERGLDPEEEYARQESSRVVRELIAGLPLKYREVVRLCKIEELKTSEAAGHLGVRVGTIKARMHRARRMIENHINESKPNQPQTFRADGLLDSPNHLRSSPVESAVLRPAKISGTRRACSRRPRSRVRGLFPSGGRIVPNASALMRPGL